MSTAERAEMAEQQSTANEKFETRPEPPLPPPLGKQEEKNPEVKEEKGADKKEMKPWEQHSAVISIPRFDYNAPSALLQHSHSGFLITCPIKREKSATKEVMSIFEKYLGSHNSYSERMEKLDVDAAAKRRKTFMGPIKGESLSSSESTHDADRHGDSGKLQESSASPADSDISVGKVEDLSLVKLTRSGLLLFTYPRNKSPPVVDIVANIIQSLESGCSKSPLWCHRMFPIQATCSIDENEIRSTVSKLVNQFVTNQKNELAQPLKFAVGYNRRGIEETKMIKITKTDSLNSSALSMLDRNKCFTVVASAVKDAVPDSIVELKCPEVGTSLANQ
ncbi:Hypothetical predicted protein [Olea europaea subsp. europaea]|uniref:THUMP domain-containing protein n=1 Tax=Olea europaea subsp. europaea TaxID=158383 RepID=A0A8S0RTH4_OLEEU|nr:Hypothetical predicted protein [Olea europaea subsp. europaea]